MIPRKSTIVRANRDGVRLRAVRTGFGLAERVVPAVGAAVAERLWFTLPRSPAQRRHRSAAVPAGRPFTADVGGRTVRGTRWGAGDAVYLVHGWGGWGTQLAALVPPLVDAGLRVVAFDALSHGESDAGVDGPRSTAAPEMADSLRAVVAMHGPAHAVIAHSLGALSTAWALGQGLTTRRMVFVSPAGSIGPTADYLGRVFGFGPRTRARLMGRVERRLRRRYDVSVADVDLANVCRSLADADDAPELLVLHDRADPEAPLAVAVAIHKAWPGSRLTETTDLGHRRILRDPRTIAEVCDFVAARHGQPAPTTAVRRSVAPEPFRLVPGPS